MEKEVKDYIDSQINALRDELKSNINGVASQPKPKPNPNFNPDGKGKHKKEWAEQDTILLMATKENQFHKQGEIFEAKGHQATVLIKKGLADEETAEIKPEPKPAKK